jgi:hypothetical protein
MEGHMRTTADIALGLLALATGVGLLYGAFTTAGFQAFESGGGGLLIGFGYTVIADGLTA